MAYGDQHFICAPEGKNRTALMRDFDILNIADYDGRFLSAFATTTLTAIQTQELKNLGYKVRLNFAPYTDL